MYANIDIDIDEARGKETKDLNAFAMLKQSLKDEIAN